MSSEDKGLRWIALVRDCCLFYYSVQIRETTPGFVLVSVQTKSGQQQQLKVYKPLTERQFIKMDSESDANGASCCCI